MVIEEPCWHTAHYFITECIDWSYVTHGFGNLVLVVMFQILLNAVNRFSKYISHKCSNIQVQLPTEMHTLVLELVQSI